MLAWVHTLPVKILWSKTPSCKKSTLEGSFFYSRAQAQAQIGSSTNSTVSHTMRYSRLWLLPCQIDISLLFSNQKIYQRKKIQVMSLHIISAPSFLRTLHRCPGWVFATFFPLFPLSHLTWIKDLKFRKQTLACNEKVFILPRRLTWNLKMMVGKMIPLPLPGVSCQVPCSSSRG